MVDLVANNEEMMFPRESHIKVSNEFDMRKLSVKAGQPLTTKMIEFAQRFYDLKITIITNIPMKVNIHSGL